MESASSDAKKKDLEQMRSALEENTSVVKELLAAHSRATTLVQELNSEVKDTKWQLQEMQEADERGRASINEKAQGIPQERGRPSGTAQGSNGRLLRARHRDRRESYKAKAQEKRAQDSQRKRRERWRKQQRRKKRKERGRSRRSTRGPRNEQRRRRWKDSSARTTTRRNGRSTQKMVRSTGSTA